MRGRAAKVAGLLLLVAIPTLAQVSESTTVEVVQVPVYVTAHGAPVSNLSRENFRLFVNGKPQSIDYFDVLDFAALQTDEARDPRQRRLYLLIFDLAFSSANALQRAQKAAERMIESGAPIDTFGIATLTASRGADVIVPFSSDRQAIVRAVRNLRPSRMPDPLRLALTPSEREAISGGPGFRGGIAGGGEENAMPELQMQMVREVIENAIGDLADLAVRLAPLEGIKHIVLLSTGFDASLIHGVVTPRYIADARDNMVRGANPAFNPGLLDAIRKMHQTFASSSVFLDAVDIGGLRPMQRAYDNEALYMLARDTGGQVVDHRNDLTSAMRTLVDLQQVAYVLSFNAPNTGRAENKITVKLVHAPPGSHASYRESYSTVVDPPDSGDPLRLADIVMNDIPQSGVTTSMSVEPESRGATINVTVAGGELAAMAAGMTLEGEALLYVFSGPSAVAFHKKQISIEPRAMAALARSPLRIMQTFDLPPGHYAAKVLIRFGVNATLGFARSDFTVWPAIR